MIKIFKAVTYFLLISIVISCDKERKEESAQILVFSKTEGYRHNAIPEGIRAIRNLGVQNQFTIDTTQNSAVFASDSLKKYGAIVFLNTTGNLMNAEEEAGFERYIQAGGGYVGVHGAADAEYDWNWYGRLVGAYFESHPQIQQADFVVEDKEFPATSFLTDSIWKREDELYNFKKINPDVHVVLSIDESSYEGGTNGKNHPMSWYHEYDGGRAFYTELGHTEESYGDQNYLDHLMGGISYALGDRETLDYGKATSQYPPEADRFSKKQLSQGEFFEPTEMTILPNLDILVAQRRGEIMLFDHETEQVSEVGFLDVYSKTLNTPGVNAEEGVMGLKKDPNFEKNHWVYVYYAPTGEAWINRLSRFKFEDDTFQNDSEQVILEIDTQREICCHTGGSIAFGPEGLLYLSTGDNSTPFDQKDVKFVNSGFAPLNDTPDDKQFDARRSAGNTNDLRGKILRLKINEDGSYDIPEGNLFPKGTEKTRPEIYTMGHRNPYRISVDKKNGNLYWGEVGPDANEDSLATRGPKGYDELNQAREAGNYGWPFLIADNKPYRKYDYATGESGEFYDPENLINDSENNTGLEQLPPAQPSYVWYPYDASDEFPQVGEGGRNAMAGPVYYSDMFPEETSLPEYYDGKVLVYDWMRGWMMAVSLFPNGDFNKMEPFASEVKLNSLIDMEVGPDGKIYLLEYGSGWFSKNDDSGLARIDFNSGNRAPLVNSFKVDKSSGSLPLTINASVEARDRENDSISYVWHLGENTVEETSVPTLQHTFNKGGSYKVYVTVKDAEGAEASTESVTVYAGNERPQVTIAVTEGNKSFFIPGVPLKYEVTIEDQEDGEDLDESNIFVSSDYMEGMDGASVSRGHQQVSASIMGKSLTQSMDCRSCHKVGEKSVGPSYMDVSERYKGNDDTYTYLSQKIMAGGAGNWGEVMMPAHPNLTETETRQIIEYIVSLTSGEKVNESLPTSGTLTPKTSDAGKTLVLTASYTDGGTDTTTPLTGTAELLLPGNTLMIDDNIRTEGFTMRTYDGKKILLNPETRGWFATPEIDLYGVKEITVNLGWQGPRTLEPRYEIRLDGSNGEFLGMGTMEITEQENQGKVTVSLENKIPKGKHTLYITYEASEGDDTDTTIAVTGVTFKGKEQKE